MACIFSRRKELMPRVLITTPSPTSVGGVERFSVLLARVLTAGGHDVRLASPSRVPGRWAMRFALTPLLASRSVPARFDGWEPDLVVTNGFLGGFGHRR